MKPLTDATLRVRDAIYTGLLVREGAELTEAVARERANNICTAVIETLIEGLQLRLADVNARAVPGQDVIADNTREG